MKKLARYFDVDELVVLGKTVVDLKNPNRLSAEPRTAEAKILAHGIDKLPKAQREQALNVVKAMFSQYSDYFEKGVDE